MGNIWLLSLLFVSFLLTTSQWACDRIHGDPGPPLGEMAIVPEKLPTDGSKAEVRVWIMWNDEGLPPVQGMDVMLLSSRNQGGEEVDVFEQPMPTDEDGLAVGFVSSEVTGQTIIVVEASGVALCEYLQNQECTRLQRVVEFVEP